MYDEPEQHPDSDVLKFYFFQNAEEMIGVLREFARLLQENRRIRPDSQSYEFLEEIKALVAQITSPTILEVAEDLDPRDPLEWVEFVRRRSTEHWPVRETKLDPTLESEMSNRRLPDDAWSTASKEAAAEVSD